MITTNLAEKAKQITRFKQHPYISQDLEIEIDVFPYPHIIIKNLFTSEVLNSMCDKFEIFAARVPEGNNRSDNYGGRLYGLSVDDTTSSGYDFFTSRFWKDFVGLMFDMPNLNDQVASQVHEHRVPSESGWVHRDCQICNGSGAPSHLNQENLYIINNNKHTQYGDDDDNVLEYKEHPVIYPKIARSVAGLFYYNNPDEAGKALKGGGTGIFREDNIMTLDKVMEPVNNSMLLFECGSNSNHTYIGTKEFRRCAFVQWFHEDVNVHLNRKRKEIEASGMSIGQYFQRWKAKTPWYYHDDYPWK